MNAGNVFRAYDIRGVVDKDFNAEWVTHLGKACGTYLAGRGISSAVIGYDCRHSSPAYHDALVEGILSTGTDVISIGMVPTPALYFAVKHLNRQGGVMITASHNPPEYNGFKVWAGQSTIHGEEIQKIKTIFEEGAFAEGTGTASRIDIIPTYKQISSAASSWSARSKWCSTAATERAAKSARTSSPNSAQRSSPCSASRTAISPTTTPIPS